jgi:hypothetical protein
VLASIGRGRLNGIRKVMILKEYLPLNIGWDTYRDTGRRLLELASVWLVTGQLGFFISRLCKND